MSNLRIKPFRYRLPDSRRGWFVRVTDLTELALSLVVALLVVALTAHLLISVVQLPLLSAGPVSVRPVVIELLDILILLELSQVFLGLERHHRLDLLLLLDLAATFSIRELILSLFTHGQGATVCVLAMTTAILLRVVCAKSRACRDSRDCTTSPEGKGKI